MACQCEQMVGSDSELSARCIGHLWLFENLGQVEIDALSQEARRKKVAKGQTLFLQGDAGNELFLIKGGHVKLTKLLENGGEITLDICKPGDFIGENMFAEDDISHYPVSAFCLEDTLTCGFSRSQFEKIVLKHPAIGLQVIKNLSRRIAWLSGHVGSLAMSNIEERLYRVLVSIAKAHGSHDPQGTLIQFPLTHEELSFLTGAHRVSITRAIKNLKNTGKIIHDAKRLILPAV